MRECQWFLSFRLDLHVWMCVFTHDACIFTRTLHICTVNKYAYENKCTCMYVGLRRPANMIDACGTAMATGTEPRKDSVTCTTAARFAGRNAAIAMSHLVPSQGSVSSSASKQAGITTDTTYSWLFFLLYSFFLKRHPFPFLLYLFLFCLLCVASTNLLVVLAVMVANRQSDWYQWSWLFQRRPI